MRYRFNLALVACAWLYISPDVEADPLHVVADETAGTIAVFRDGSETPIVTQHARPDFRPYLHPIVAPDGNGFVTEYSPGHHKHQTGVYWGITKVNGRDYFHHPTDGYWRRVSATVLRGERKPGNDAKEYTARWQTVYDMLDAEGEVVLTETQTWTMSVDEGEYILDLEWVGEARTDVTIGKYPYGGLFIRMPWHKGIDGAAVNAQRHRNEQAEGKRSPWVDVGMQVEGRDDWAHIAIFDHPNNPGYPQHWRVDWELGVGPIRARLADWHIAKGKKASIQHRLFVYTGEMSDVYVTKKWADFSGHDMPYSLWGLAVEGGRQATFMTAEDAVEAMTVQEGFAANVYASEPTITQPMAFCWDDRGRLWVAENRDYETRGRGFANSGDSRILILEDTDRDGVADVRKVFSEGIPFPAAIAVGFDGVFLGSPPNLLFLPDRDGDDKADADAIEVRLTGWGIRDRHETLNSFHWGPDGWLYGCQGFATPSTVGKPVGKGRLFKHNDPFPKDLEIENPVDINGGVWRYHPTKERFEVVAHGFSNPWGIDYDANGQFFISACVIPHLWHVIPGGIYHRQGGPHFNPYVYSDIKTITDHQHQSAHGGARVYLSDAFPERYHGRLFMANIHEHAILTDILEPKGSGFVGHHGDDFLLANNGQWVGFSVEIGPEGGVYVLDWHDGSICGDEVRNKETGRIFRITPTASRAKNWNGRYGDLRKLTNRQLVDLQHSESSWHARRARVILQGRAVKGEVGRETHNVLGEILDGGSSSRLRALWTLHITGGLDEKRLLAGLEDRDAIIRAWSIQLLCEDMKPSARALEKFAAMARSDASPVVRLYLASALQRIKLDKRWSIAEGLVARAEDVEDHNIPKMLWFGIEPLVPRDPKRAVELARRSQMPLISRHIARRLADADHFEELIAGIGAIRDVRLELLRGFLEGMDGRSDVKEPEGWADMYGGLNSEDGELGRLAVELAQKFGDAEAVRIGLRVLEDTSAGVEVRRRALLTVAKIHPPELPPILIDLLDHDELRGDSIRAMANFQEHSLVTALLDRYDTFNDDEKSDTVHTLASRPHYGWMLAQAIKNKKVPRRDVPTYIARQLRRVVGSGFVEIWGPIDEVSAEKETEIAKYRELLTDEKLASADASRGRTVFDRTCGSCHTMYGAGGKIAPDITGANRTDLNYVLGNVLTPSAEIQDAYKMNIVLMADGRIYSGVLAGESERQIQLRVVGENDPVAIPKSAILSREVAAVSMMPDGLWSTLTDREVLDLVAYLRTTEQVPLPDVGGK
jgi:putative membrane-bound dehydrogenase-like protein